MNEQIEQLKADKAALEAAQIVMRKHGCGISKYIEQTVVVIQETINELERQADDPWKEAKQLVEHWHRANPLLDKSAELRHEVSLYVRHLEGKVKELESVAIPAEVFQRAALQRRIKHQRRELKRLNNAMKQWAAKALLDNEKIKGLNKLAHSSGNPAVYCAKSNVSGNYFRLYDQPALFATYDQARNWPGVPKEWIIEPYTGEKDATDMDF
jgi:hypothetical protein